jgi:hypothetical protein
MDGGSAGTAGSGSSKNLEGLRFYKTKQYSMLAAALTAFCFMRRI